MAEVRIKDIDEHEIDTILAEDIDFEGHLTFKKPLMIKGKFKGEIKSTSALYIGEKAYVEASTEADIVSSKGRHKGDILGHSHVELFSTAQVDGDITTPDFVVESGCKFNGNCSMGGEAGKVIVVKKEGEAAASPVAVSTGSPEQPQRPQAQASRVADASHVADTHRPSAPPGPPQQQGQQPGPQGLPFPPSGTQGGGGGQR
jgi:cytoskeletal protein CcmA (bactofilin family)